MNIRAAKLTLFESLVTNKNGTPIAALRKYVDRIFLNPPTPGNLKQKSIVIVTREVTPFFIGIDLAIYVSAQENPSRSAELLDEIIEVIEENNLISSEYGPSSWEISFSEENLAWVAISPLEWGREEI